MGEPFAMQRAITVMGSKVITYNRYMLAAYY